MAAPTIPLGAISAATSREREPSGTLSRREILKAALAAPVMAPAMVLATPALAQGAGGRVVIIGGGFGGASCARTLRRIDPRAAVTLVEQSETFTACPFSNEVIAGLREFRDQQFGYDNLRATGVTTAFAAATAVDAAAQTVTLANSTIINYDRLILAPGIDLRFDRLSGYSEAAAQRMPHAWKAGAQTMLLRRQLQAMDDGGLVVISAPVNPARCPPGIYERASLIAHYLKTQKPKSKVLVLDAKDTIPLQAQFVAAWKALYPDHLEWIPLSEGGRVTAVEPDTNTVMTDFDRYDPAVANIIPPQKAGRVAEVAGVADRTGWCPIDPVTFESTLQPKIHVIGDSCISGGMPKSASAASSAGKACAAAVIKLLRGEMPDEQELVSTCYSMAAPDQAFAIAGTYRPRNGQLVDVPTAGGGSPANTPHQQAFLAEDWFKAITRDVFG